jgi:hypothetical protein
LYQSWLSWSLIRGSTWTDGTIDPGTARDWTDIHLNYNKRPMGKLCLPRRQLQLLSYQHLKREVCCISCSVHTRAETLLFLF